MIKKLLRRTCVYAAICTLICVFFLSTTNCVSAQTISEGKAECVMEVNSRRVLYQRRGDVRLPMASTTKIATCITVIELCDDLQREVTVPKESVGVEGSSVYLQAGDVYTVEELLYGLMLRSGNDCAETLALYCCGSIDRFAAKMNETAQKAGALATHFDNPHGLPSKNHYTTAYDLSLITCYAMQNDVFREIVSTQYYAPRHWKNKNKLLHLYDDAVGVKTGYTKEAGRCLVSAATRNGMTIVTTLLHCPTTYERSIRLLDDAFAAYRRVKVLSKDEPFRLKSDWGTLLAHAKEDRYYPLLAEEEALLERRAVAYDRDVVKKKNDDSVGEFSIYLAKRLLFSGILYKL